MRGTYATLRRLMALRPIALSMTLLGTLGCSTSRAREVPIPPDATKATFAGGCFWCMEAEFERIPGVLAVVSGFAGGRKPNPTYDEVSAGGTGYAESIQVVYPSQRVSYQTLLEHFWRNIDPTAKDAQFCDQGDQYRSVIFYHSPEQRKLAEESKRALERSSRFKEQPIYTQITQLKAFYPAEEYHQDFYKKDPLRYHAYRSGCGRDRRLHELWGNAR